MKQHEELLEEFQREVLQRLDLSRDISDEELMELIHKIMKERGKDYIPLSERTKIGKELFHSFRKLNVLQELLEDDTISEIMVNGTQNIFIERQGRIEKSQKRFVSRGKLEDIIQQIVAGVNRTVNEASPIVDARLPDGSRVHVVLYPAALNGPILTIRKFPKDSITMKQLIEWNSISKEAADYLNHVIKEKKHILISGSTGSGKSTFLNALSDYIPKDERIITIEDNAELRIQNVSNLVRLEARNANMEGEGALTIRDLLKASLRMRPNWLIVGEVRSVEAVDMLQALNTGHPGASTIHANSAKDALSRLETMVLMGMDIPGEAVQRQIAAGIDVIVHIGRLRDRSRKVLEICEISGYEAQEIQLKPIYRFFEEGEIEGKIKGALKYIKKR